MSDTTNELVVVGGGAAGLSCALAAALRGVNVMLLEKTGQIGGTVRGALIHTLAGLFDGDGNFINDGLPVLLAERLIQACAETRKRRIGKTWVLNADPEVYAGVLEDWIATTPNLQVCYDAIVTDIAVDAGRVSQLDVTCRDRAHVLRPRSVVDTTGNAAIVRHAAPHSVDQGLALAGFIVHLRGVQPDALAFPKGVAVLREIRKAVQRNELSPACSTVWLDTGVYPDEAYAKFNIAAESCDHDHLHGVADQLLDFLHALPGFTNAFIKTRGQLGIRDGGRIKGDYCLSERDVKDGRRFTDAACRACWPIEHWHPEKGITLEYLPEGCVYDIPLRSLKVAGFKNLWAAGKCLSAEPRAQASARMAGTCWAMGEAVGKNVAEGAVG